MILFLNCEVKKSTSGLRHMIILKTVADLITNSIQGILVH